MGFQILDKEGKALEINQLDREACELWKVDYDEKYYAYPEIPFENKDNLEGIELTKAKFKHKLNQPINWFDSIGWEIHQYGKSLEQIKKDYIGKYRSFELTIDEIMTIKPFCDYINLLDLWIQKGYKAKQIK